MKVHDDLVDEGKLSARASQWLYRSSFRRSRQHLLDLGFNVEELEHLLASQTQLELRQEGDLLASAAPTGAAYALVASHIASLAECSIPTETSHRIGAAIGQCIYLADAFADAAGDLGTSYNPVNIGDNVEFRRAELRRIVLSLFEEIRREVQLIGHGGEERWGSLETRLRRRLGIAKTSVVLNATYCIPCGGGGVAVDSNECNNCICGVCCWIFCICPCCLQQC